MIHARIGSRLPTMYFTTEPNTSCDVRDGKHCHVSIPKGASTVGGYAITDGVKYSCPLPRATEKLFNSVSESNVSESDPWMRSILRGFAGV